MAICIWNPSFQDQCLVSVFDYCWANVIVWAFADLCTGHEAQSFYTHWAAAARSRPISAQRAESRHRGQSQQSQFPELSESHFPCWCCQFHFSWVFFSNGIFASVRKKTNSIHDCSFFGLSKNLDNVGDHIFFFFAKVARSCLRSQQWDQAHSSNLLWHMWRQTLTSEFVSIESGQRTCLFGSAQCHFFMGENKHDKSTKMNNKGRKDCWHLIFPLQHEAKFPSGQMCYNFAPSVFVTHAHTTGHTNWAVNCFWKCFWYSLHHVHQCD